MIKSMADGWITCARRDPFVIGVYQLGQIHICEPRFRNAATGAYKPAAVHRLPQLASRHPDCRSLPVATPQRHPYSAIEPLMPAA